MKHTWMAAVAVAVIATAGTAGKVKVKPSVTYAKSWDAAIAEAKMLNLPIVVHSHGFL